MLIVMKFGGTSVGSADRIAQAARLVTDQISKGHRVAVVTSAMSGVTNTLIDAARAASKGQWDSSTRHRLFDTHRTAAAALVPDEAGQAQVIAEISRRHSSQRRYAVADAGRNRSTPPRYWSRAISLAPPNR
jgi:aspartokinase